MATKSLIILSLLSLTMGASSSFKKCCPPGKVFSGTSTVDCIPTPPYSAELYPLDFDNEDHGKFPICEEPQHITTAPVYELSATDFLQKPSCIEILHEQTTRQSDPIFVYCKSNEYSRRINEYTAKPYEDISGSELVPKLLNVRRCCSNSTVFNVETGTCESPDNRTTVDEFLSFLPKELNVLDFLNIRTGLPSCSGAFFTYEVDAEDVTFANGILQASLPSRKSPNAEKMRIADWNSCLEMTTDFRSERRFVVRVCRDKEQCKGHTCLQKCCSNDMKNSNSLCKKIHKSGSQMNFYQEIANVSGKSWTMTDYGVMVGLTCPNKMYRLSSNEIYDITQEGHIKTDPIDKGLSHDKYCIDTFYDKKRQLDGLNVFACFESSVPEEPVTITKYVISSILIGISCIFLLLTLIVYACLPLLQNLHGKTLMCHAASLFMAYACLCIIPWVTPNMKPTEDEYATKFCSALGFTMLFFFLSAFCWLNVMCFDIWRTFGRLQGDISRGRGHRKRFLLYCLYAWGLSMFITIFGILADEMHILPVLLRPNFGTESCWFDDYQGQHGELIFFRGPVAIQLTLNVVFFILTAEQCSKVKAEIRRVADPTDPRSKRFHADKTKFIMNVKLFIVMGISWVAEIISSFVNRYTNFCYSEELFYATDVLNTLQGVLIFFLFVMKRRVHQALMKRLGFDSKKKSNSSQITSALHDPYRVKKSASNSTLTSSFGVSLVP